MSNKKVDVTGPSQAASSMDKLSGSTDRVSSATTSLTSKMSSAFGNVKSSLTDLQNSIQNMATSLAGIAIGGSISGLTWKASAETKLINDQIKEAIENNKRLGISYEELDKFVQEQAEAGEGTKQDTVKELYATLMAGGKYFKGTGQEKLNLADAVGDFYFAHQELMREEQIGSAEQLIQRVSMQTGKMQGRFGIKLATAMGLDPEGKEFKSAKSRIKALTDKGSTIDMKVEMEKRPWEQLEVNISKLKYAIGDSIAGPLVSLTNVIAVVVEKLSKIPGLPALIGLMGATLALASAFSLVIGVMTPLWKLMKAVDAALKISTTLKAIDATVTYAEAEATLTATGMKAGEASVEEMSNAIKNVSITTRIKLVAGKLIEIATSKALIVANTLHLTTLYGILTAENMSVASKLRLIGAKVWDTAASYANSAANLLGISSLLGLASAEGVATVGAYGLAAGIWAALSPLLPFVAAGLLIVGVLALIANKFGILQPIINSFKKAFSGDFSGAWKTLTDIKLPSIKWDFSASGIKGALSEVFSGTNFITTIIRLLGVPLYKLIDFAEQIRDLLKKVKDFVEYMSGLFYKYIYSPLKGIWDKIESLVSFLIGGAGKTGSELTESVKSEISKRVEDYATGANPGTSLRGLSTEQIDYLAKYTSGDKSVTPEMATALGITGPMLEEAKKIAEDLKHPKGMLNGGTSIATIAEGASEGLNTAIEEHAENTNKNLAEGMPAFAAADWSTLTSLEYGWEAAKGIYNKLFGNSKVKKAASGGEITKEGLLYGHVGEPIIPAEIASNSNLISLLENLSSETVTTESNNPTYIVHMTYNAPAGSNRGRYLDDFEFERAVKNIIGKCTRTYGAY
ncbi:hypothetical protein [Bacteroides sp.]|uniref:hypothetical protein n=1 Tax=Bacteroides sp. TaxID=29523 RepID=UPI00261DEB8D|nr:hypothetical protein [Bacteroides sp.]MDD3040726.1 hypothetical protein [Bacteroides sp.]